MAIRPMNKQHRSLRKKMEQAILDYNMIQKGDRILIGVSGGADSLGLLDLFLGDFIHVTNDFSLVVVHIDMGFRGESHSQTLKEHFKSLHLDHHILKTRIGDHALDPNAKKNPCFICSMYRRKKIYEIAHQEKCNKIAYGHHKDDIIETLLINIIYGRQINTMNPVQEIFQGSMHIIRPLMYCDEVMVKSFSKNRALPVAPKMCPMDGKTRREKVKKIIAGLQKTEKNANIRENIFKSLKYVHIDFPCPIREDS